YQLSAVLMILAIYIQYAFNVKPDWCWISTVHDLAVRNREEFFRLNPKFKLNLSWTWLKGRKQIAKQVKEFTKVYQASETAHFAHAHLDHFPTLSRKLRLCLVLVSITLNVVYWLIKAAYMAGFVVMLFNFSLVTSDIEGASWTIFFLVD